MVTERVRSALGDAEISISCVWPSGSVRENDHTARISTRYPSGFSRHRRTPICTRRHNPFIGKRLSPHPRFNAERRSPSKSASCCLHMYGNRRLLEHEIQRPIRYVLLHCTANSAKRGNSDSHRTLSSDMDYGLGLGRFLASSAPSPKLRKSVRSIS